MSNEIFHSNLAVLKERFPTVYERLIQGSSELPFKVEGFMTRCGQANAYAAFEDGRRIAFHEDEDIYNIIEELMADWQLDTQDILFCVGMGLGYCPLVAAGKFSGQPQIVVIEPQIAIFETALKSLDLRSLLNYPRLNLFIGHNLRISAIIDQYHFQIFLGKQRVATHVPSRTISGPFFVAVETELKEKIALTKDLWKTNKELGRDMLSNLMSNLPSLFNGVPIGKMRGMLAGRPALCVSAGPSLDEALPVIRKLQDKVLLVALDSAISTLIPAGIRPQIVATCDTRRINFEKLRPYIAHLRDSILVFVLESNPDNVRAFLSPHRLAVASDSVFVKSWLAPSFQIDCNLPAMSTVSHTVIYSMMVMGADPIIVTGMDMAFPGDKSHAKYSVNKYDIPANKIVEVQGTNGLSVRTYRPMIDYTRQLESIVAGSSQRFINTSLNGMLMRGMQVKSLQEVADTELGAASGFKKLLDGLKWENEQKDADIISALRSKRGELERHRDQCSRGIREADDILDRLPGQEFGDVLQIHLDKLKNHYENLQKENSDLIRLLFPIRLEKIRQIEIRRQKLHCNPSAACDSEKKIEELQIIKEDLSSQLEAAVFFCSLIAQREDYYRRLCKLKEEFSIDSKNHSILLKLANLYSEAGEIMLAEKSYLLAVKHAPDDVRIRLDLIRMFAGLELWGPALEHVRKAYRDFSDNPDLKAVKEEIDNNISGILNRIRTNWEKGDKAISQKLLNEYLLLGQDNPEANRIKGELEEHDAKIASDLPSLDQHLIPEKQFEALLAKAAAFIQNLEFEPAIGILEGLIERFPIKAAGLREKIGDCRQLQQDYKSALWNYGQALKFAPKVSGIRTKIDDIRRRMETLPYL